MTNTELLRKKAIEGLEELGFHNDQEYRERLGLELKTIEELEFVPYFLVMWDIANFVKKNKILAGPGRGSAAGSLLCYCLGITSIDPVKYGLYFERFLNPSRGSLIDLGRTDLEKIKTNEDLTTEDLFTILES